MSPESPEVSYCINTFFCDTLVNPGHDLILCQTCGAKLLVGDRYRLIGLLEKPQAESNKRVFLGNDTQNNDEKVVLKIVDYPKDNLAKYLIREYEFLRSVGDPFPKVEDGSYFEWLPDSNNDFYTTHVLVLPWIEGLDSLEWIKKEGKLSEPECLDWIFQILEYLENFSNLAVMHRDIKPENIIVSSDQPLKLIDFGSVRAVDAEYLKLLEDTTLDSEGRISRGTRLFTFGYSPPEQLIGKAVLQSDFFSFGKTIIYWLTGKTPADFIEEDIDDWSTCCPGVSKTLIRFIEWLTAHKVGARPVNAEAIREFLEDQYPLDIEREKRVNPVPFRNPRFYLSCFLAIGAILGMWFGLTQTLYSQAVGAFERTQYDSARRKFNQVLKLNPLHGEAFYYLGLGCQREKDSDCAEENFQKSLRWSWNRSLTQYQLGILAENLGNYDEAYDFYSASNDSRQNPESYNRLARLKIKNGQLLEAQELIQSGLELANDNDMKARLLAQQGRIYFEQNQWRKAEQVLKESDDLVNTAESACLLPKIAKELKRPDSEIDRLWYFCFYSPSEYSEGADYKEDLLRKALPKYFIEE